MGDVSIDARLLRSAVRGCRCCAVPWCASSVMTLRLPKRGFVSTRPVRSGVSKHCAKTLDNCCRSCTPAAATLHVRQVTTQHCTNDLSDSRPNEMSSDQFRLQCCTRHISRLQGTSSLTRFDLASSFVVTVARQRCAQHAHQTSYLKAVAATSPVRTSVGSHLLIGTNLG